MVCATLTTLIGGALLRTSSTRGYRLLVVVVAAGLVVAIAAPISASNFVTNRPVVCAEGPGSNTPCMTDTADFSWNAELGPRMSNAVLDTLYNSYDTTDLVVEAYPSHDSSVDVHYQMSQLPDSVFGMYQCVYKVPGSTFRCNHGHIRFDPEASAGLSDDELRGLACHETGHSVGLTHGAEASPVMSNGDDELRCMQTPIAQVVPTLGPHNAAHIDANY